MKNNLYRWRSSEKASLASTQCRGIDAMDEDYTSGTVEARCGSPITVRLRRARCLVLSCRIAKRSRKCLLWKYERVNRLFRLAESVI